MGRGHLTLPYEELLGLFHFNVDRGVVVDRVEDYERVSENILLVLLVEEARVVSPVGLRELPDNSMDLVALAR